MALMKNAIKVWEWGIFTHRNKVPHTPLTIKFRVTGGRDSVLGACVHMDYGHV